MGDALFLIFLTYSLRLKPLMVPVFLRSLNATLSRKFPINSAGDPFATLVSHPYVHSIISLLTLPTTPSRGTPTQTLAPLEQVSVPETYLPYLTATHMTPLQVIQALLPVLRTGPAFTQDHKLDKTVIVCLPALDVRVGLPFASVGSMSAAATERGVEVLRRELEVAAKGTPVIWNIKVVVVDVGLFDVGASPVKEREEEGEMIRKAMRGWTASGQLCYGTAFTRTLRGLSPVRQVWEMLVTSVKGTGEPRKPTDVSVFVDNVVDVVDCGRGVYRGCELGLGLGRIRNWVRGERFSVGTGGWFFFFFSALKDLMDLSFFFIAQTSRFASYLPWAVLDLVIDIPHSLRNRLFKTQQPLRELPPLSTPVTVPSVVISRSKTSTASEHDDGSSEADVESVSGDSGVSSGSWVDLNAGQPGRG